jgi:hypothetical protein
MNAPHLQKEICPLAPVRGTTALIQHPPRAWKNLSEASKLQIASVVADMAKRMAAKAAEDRTNANDHDL